MKPPSLRIAPFVSREHGEAFAKTVVEQIMGTEAVTEAFGVTEVMDWPGEEDEATLTRFNRIEREILSITFELAKRHIADIFTAVATVVLQRERDRDE